MHDITPNKDDTGWLQRELDSAHRAVLAWPRGKLWAAGLTGDHVREGDEIIWICRDCAWQTHSEHPGKIWSGQGTCCVCKRQVVVHEAADLTWPNGQPTLTTAKSWTQ